AKAREALERHLTKHPDDAFAHTQLGKALADVDQGGAALTEFQRALSLDPDSEEAQRLTGLALGRKGDEAEGFYPLALSSRRRGDELQLARDRAGASVGARAAAVPGRLPRPL